MLQKIKGQVVVASDDLGRHYTITRKDDQWIAAQPSSATGAFSTFEEALKATEASVAKNGHTMARKTVFVDADSEWCEDLEIYFVAVEVTPAFIATLVALEVSPEGTKEVRLSATNVQWEAGTYDANLNYQDMLVTKDGVCWATGYENDEDGWEARSTTLTFDDLVDALAEKDDEVYHLHGLDDTTVSAAYVLGTPDLPKAIYELEDDPERQIHAILQLRRARSEGKAELPTSIEEKKGLMLETWKVADGSYCGVGYRVIAKSIWGQMYGLMHGRIVRVDPNLPTFRELSPAEEEEVLTHSANGFLEFGVWRRYSSTRHQTNPVRVLHAANRCWVPWDFKFVMPS